MSTYQVIASKWFFPSQPHYPTHLLPIRLINMTLAALSSVPIFSYSLSHARSCLRNKWENTPSWRGHLILRHPQSKNKYLDCSCLTGEGALLEGVKLFERPGFDQRRCCWRSSSKLYWVPACCAGQLLFLILPESALCIWLSIHFQGALHSGLTITPMNPAYTPPG